MSQTNNTDSKPSMSFVGAMRDFFGFKPGQGLSDFSAELKALGPEDKAYFTAELGKVGYSIH